jgi:hypothetical protein
MLVIGTCEGAGVANIFLVVKTSNSPALTALYYAFNQGGTEAPFSLDVATDRLGTFAFFTSQGHDMQSAYSTTTVYKIDPATGYATLYPLLLTAQGKSAVIYNSEPVISESNFKDSEMSHDGRLVRQFLSYSDNLCKPNDNQCQPVTTTRFSWNGREFAETGYEKKRRDYLAKLARQRQCVKQKFDAKKGTEDCTAEFECPKYNDLSLLNLKAGNLADARNYAEGALDYCRSNFTEFQAAQYNYLKSEAKLGELPVQAK